MDPGSEQRQLAAGTMLDEKYRVDSLLAVGGMGAVYVGTHTKLRKRVAIKVLNPDISTPQMIERFHREAITASQVGHEGIAQVTDIGTSAAGEPFLVMELLEGESLGTRLRSTGPLPIHEAAELACAILAPLGAAHRAGIVHRDLKPDNVFLVKQSRGEMVKLLDFGISRATGLETEFRLTTTGLVLGTPYYMSPEQAQGSTAITPASDLYSLGVMLYEMLIGKVPIQGDNYNQLMYHVITGSYTPPRQLRGDVPPALERVVMRAMALSPTERPATAAELEHDLLVFCRPTFRAHVTESGASQRISLMTPAPRLTGAPMAVGTDGHGASGVGHGGGGIGTEQTMMATADRQAYATGPQPGQTGPQFGQSGPQYGQMAGGYGAPGMGTGTGQVAGQMAGAPKRRSLGMWLGGGVLLAGGVIVAVVLGGSGAKEKPAGEPATAPTAAPAASAASAAPTAPTTAPTTPEPTASPTPPTSPPPAVATVRLRFDVEPAETVIAVDGKPLTGHELEVPRDDAEHQLQYSAPGFIAEEETVRFDESQRLKVRLKEDRKRTRPDRTRPDRTDRPERTRPDRIDSDSPYK